MQTGGLLKDLTVARDGPLHGGPVRRRRVRSTRSWRRAGIAEIADRQRQASAPGASSSGSASPWPSSATPSSSSSTSRRPAWTSRPGASFWESIRADAEQGRTVLFATHYLEEADAYADRIVLVRQGRIVADGTAAEIKALGAGRTVRATWPDGDLATRCGG